jgi:selenocysteine lyase/cysteine desulfurase
MKLDRKTFLQRSALGAAGWFAVTPARTQPTDAPPAPPLPAFDPQGPEAFWRAVRDLYPLARDLAYFNTGGLGPAPHPVLARVAEITRQLQEKSDHGHARFAAARDVAARFLEADAAEIAFVRNATEGNAIVAAGLKLSPGDEVIFESHAHPGGSYPWLHQQSLRGIVVKVFAPDPHDPDENVRRIAAQVNGRTRVVQVSHVTAPTGILLPAAAIARLCRDRGLWLHLDAAQSLGMLPLSVRALGCDSLAASGHKWLGGPHETGILYVRRDRLDEVTPTLVGAYSGESEGMPGPFRLNPTAVRYEYGTRNVAAALGLAEAMRLQDAIGRERIAGRGRELMRRIHAGLARIGGVQVLTSPNPAMSGSMLAFRTASVPYDRLFGLLLREHAIRCRPVTEQGLDALRVSTHVFNSPAECDALVAAVEKIVRHG